MSDEHQALREEISRLQRTVAMLESRARLVQQVSQEGVWDWNFETDDAYFSRRLLNTLGYDESEITEKGSTFFALLHPDDVAKTRAALQAHLSGSGEPYQAEFRMRAKDGRWLDFQARAQAEFDAEGKPVRMAGIQTDLTEQHRRERELLRHEELIAVQTETIRSLGVPILQVWRGVLCVPIIGAVDEERAATMTAVLLDRVAEVSARFVVLDLTGAEFQAGTVQYLASMTRSLRLIGSKGVLCGIGPHTAKTLIDLQLELAEVTTYRDLGDALRACLTQLQTPD